MDNNRFARPTEILKKYPELQQKWGYNTNDLGILYRCKVLRGIKKQERSYSTSVLFIDLDSVAELIKFINTTIDKNKIKV